MIFYTLTSDIIIEDLGDGTGVFFNTKTGDIFTLNTTAFYIAKTINGKTTLKEQQELFFDSLNKDSLNLSKAEIYQICENILNEFVTLQICKKEEL